MLATSFEILEKQREKMFELTSIDDFKLRESGQIAASEILENPHITLYGFDFEDELAVFVETPPTLNLSQVPFYFVSQYESAIRVITLPFDTMVQLAESVTVPDNRLIFIQSVGRAGSTLASQIFAQLPGVNNMSEPDALTLLVMARHAWPEKKAQYLALLKATIAILCKTPTEVAWVIKGRSYVIELGDWLYDLYPQAKTLFLYRSADSWMRSCMNAYSLGNEPTPQARREAEIGFRNYKKRFYTAINAVSPQQHLSYAEFMSIEWLEVMTRHCEHVELGVDVLAIRYQNWHTAPQETAVAMLEHCGCRPADLSRVYHTLTQDSQAGTSLSQDSVKQKNGAFTDADLAILQRYLDEHDAINHVDFEPPNSLNHPS